MRTRAAVFTTIFLSVVLASACSKRIEYEQTQFHANVNAINLNTATIEEFERLPNIGRRTAEAIIEFRNQNGPFRRVEHLMQIRGISEERFAQLRPYIKTE